MAQRVDLGVELEPEHVADRRGGFEPHGDRVLAAGRELQTGRQEESFLPRRLAESGGDHAEQHVEAIGIQAGAAAERPGRSERLPRRAEQPVNGAMTEGRTDERFQQSGDGARNQQPRNQVVPRIRKDVAGRRGQERERLQPR